MKKSLVLAMAMALGVTASAYAANPFSDVPAGHWAYDSISKLAAAGVIEGYGDGTFRGDRLMTRYEMAQIVAKAIAKGANIDKLAAEFADELNALGVRVAALEKKSDNVKITGQVRWSYETHSYSNGKLGPRVYTSEANRLAKPFPGTVDHRENNRSTKHRLRTRLIFTGKINDNWSYVGRLENNQYFHRTDQPYRNNAGEEETKFNYAYLTGRLGGLNVDAGRTWLWVGDGNIYDDTFDGIRVSYGKKIRVGAFYGKATQANDWLTRIEVDDPVVDETYGANIGFDLGKKVKLDFDYAKFKSAVDGADDLSTFSANLYGNITDKFGLGVIYLHAKSDNPTFFQQGASKNGFVVTANYAGAKFNKPGSWGFMAKYYQQPGGSALAHTMSGGGAAGFFTEGFKGYSLSASYTVAKNMMANIQYFDLKGRETKGKEKVLWTEFQLRF